MSDTSVVDIDREESRSAREAAEHEGDIGTCYRHHWRRDGRGGGVCECGESVSADEL